MNISLYLSFILLCTCPIFLSLRNGGKENGLQQNVSNVCSKPLIIHQAKRYEFNQ